MGVRIIVSKGVSPVGAVMARTDKDILLVIDPDQPLETILTLIEELLDGEVLTRTQSRHLREGKQGARRDDLASSPTGGI